MTSMKCDQTGHFFGYYPEHDIGFTCFECLEEFGPSGRRPANPWGYSVGKSRDSRKRRSLHLPPPPPQDVPQEPVSERDECGRRRSKPWRCLQQRCKLLACDQCAEQLINPEYVSLAKDRDLSELQGKRNSIVGPETIVRAGAATPPDQRASRELRSSTYEPLAPAGVPVSESESEAFIPPAGGQLESDSAEGEEEGESVLDDLRNKLVYRRAGHVATSALAHYHHQNNRPGRPSIPNRPAIKDQPPPREEVRRPATFIPEHLVSTMGPQNQMVTLEVDSNEASDDDEDSVPKLAVRSATQAANQALRSVHWRQRAAGMGAVPRVERA